MFGANGSSEKTYSIERPMGENNDYFLIDTIEDTSNHISCNITRRILISMEMVTKWFATLSESERKS